MTVHQEPMRWVKSSFSNQTNCVEVATLTDGSRLVRNSKRPDEAVVRYTAGEWRAFIQGVKNGEFD